MSASMQAHRKSLLLASLLLFFFAVGVTSSQPGTIQEVSELNTSPTAEALPRSSLESVTTCGLQEVDHPLPRSPLDELLSTSVQLDCGPCALSCAPYGYMSCNPCICNLY